MKIDELLRSLVGQHVGIDYVVLDNSDVQHASGTLDEFNDDHLVLEDTGTAGGTYRIALNLNVVNIVQVIYGLGPLHTPATSEKVSVDQKEGSP